MILSEAMCLEGMQVWVLVLEGAGCEPATLQVTTLDPGHREAKTDDVQSSYGER